jgi:AcrR family transcriptional regulator
VKRGTAKRDAVFAALRRLLLEHPWGEVTLETVAKEAGVSRQTLYNAFGSRYGLAEAYTVDLADALCDAIEGALGQHAEDPRAGLEAGLRLYLSVAATDPLIQRVQTGQAHADLVRIVTADAGSLLAHVGDRLAGAVQEAWGWPEERARPLSRVVARLAVSYVTTPPEDDSGDVAAELAGVLLPE